VRYYKGSIAKNSQNSLKFACKLPKGSCHRKVTEGYARRAIQLFKESEAAENQRFSMEFACKFRFILNYSLFIIHHSLYFSPPAGRYNQFKKAKQRKIKDFPWNLLANSASSSIPNSEFRFSSSEQKKSVCPKNKRPKSYWNLFYLG